MIEYFDINVYNTSVADVCSHLHFSWQSSACSNNAKYFLYKAIVFDDICTIAMCASACDSAPVSLSVSPFLPLYMCKCCFLFLHISFVVYLFHHCHLLPLSQTYSVQFSLNVSFGSINASLQEAQTRKQRITKKKFITDTRLPGYLCSIYLKHVYIFYSHFILIHLHPLSH